MGWPASPGNGPYPVALSVPAFYVLVALLGLFVALLWWVHQQYPRRKRILEGFYKERDCFIGEDSGVEFRSQVKCTG